VTGPAGSSGSATGTSRRAFLAALAAAATAVALDPFERVLVDGNAYRNARLGLEARLPAGWTYGSIADFVALRDRQKLLDQVAQEWHALKDPEELPVFLFEGPPHTRRGATYSPGIGLYDTEVDAPDDVLAAPLRLLDRMARSYRDLRLLEEPRHIRLGAAGATSTRWTYLHELDDIAQPLSVETLLVFRDGRAHTIHLADHADEPCVDEAVWARFRASLKYS
jgi:hypothetical protein